MAAARSTRERGQDWEALAEARLCSSGLQPRERNFLCRLGEIDLIMDQGKELVFIEVRYRKRRDYVSAMDSVGPAKQRRLAAAAGVYLSRNPRLAERPARFDLVCIDGSADNPDWTWVRNAFSL